MDEIRRRFMRLPVKLTEEELEKKKGELVEWVRVRADSERRLEARLAEMKEEKKQMEAEILSAAGYANRAAEVIEAREERRDVEVADHFDAGNILTIRLDTKETVATRPTTEDERQLQLGLGETPPEEPPAEEEEPPACSCIDDAVAAIDCPLHGPEAKPSQHPEDQEEGQGDGSPSDDV